MEERGLIGGSDDDDDEEVMFELLQPRDVDDLVFKGAQRSNNTSERRLYAAAADVGAGGGSPWTSECISRLFVLFIMFLIAVGFAINRMPPIHVSL